jgi:hypothetical protein
MEATDHSEKSCAKGFVMVYVPLANLRKLLFSQEINIHISKIISSVCM